MQKTESFDEKYEARKENAIKIYKGFTEVICLAIGSRVTFNSEGFNHILYKNPRNKRLKKDQMVRFVLLSKAYEVIKKSTTYQEYEEVIRSVKVNRKGQKINESKTIIYWGLIAIMGKDKLKVIIRKVGEGRPHFWSVIPAWQTTSHGDIHFRTYAKGNLDED